MAAPVQNRISYFINNHSSSLSAFYDGVVFWESFKNTNRFFVTFEEGEYAIPNNKQESIATMEITYPHVTNTTGSTPPTYKFATRNVGSSKLFQGEIEEDSAPGGLGFEAGIAWRKAHHGYVSLTELKGDRFYQSIITGSEKVSYTIKYQLSASADVGGLVTQTRAITASYYYPFTNYQLSVLREEPTLIVDIDKASELPNDIGTKGFVAVPQQCHQKIKDNLEFYLEKAGLIDKTVKRKIPKKGR